jgi:leucyl-tRNA synthetase
VARCRDAPAAGPAAVRREIHLLLKQANYDLGKLQFNTVASAAMKMLNALEKAPRDEAHAGVIAEGFSILLRILSPIAPHICHALWIELGYGTDILVRALARAGRGGADAGRGGTRAPGQWQASRRHQGESRR